MLSEKKSSLKRLKVLALIVCFTLPVFPQTPKAPARSQGTERKDLTQERVSLLSELSSLEKETQGFNDPLAEAAAKAEIADAAWSLDREWAKNLLRAAYKLVLPKADENQGQNRPAGAMPALPNAADRSRRKIRLRLLAVARRDKDLAAELMQLEEKNTGAYGKHFAAAALADQSLEAGDVSVTADYILQGIKADPTQGTAPDIINRVAMRDRALADRLILQYIGELRTFPLSSANQSDIRVFGILSSLVRPHTPFIPDVTIKVEKIEPPGPEVMRAYVGYMLEALSGLEQREPGYLRIRRAVLLSLWVPLQKYAPELSDAFLSMEGRSRVPGERQTLPTAASTEDEKRAQYERMINDGLDSAQPDEGVIYVAISGGEFDKARKMIDKLPNGVKKNQLLDAVNAEEAVQQTAKGNVYVAEDLAKELRSPSALMKVYPALIRKSVASKDRPRAARLVYQALQQIRDADTSPPSVPEGIPASAVANDEGFDPVLAFAARLATEVIPSGDDLAFDVLDQVVSFANNAPVKAERSWISFDAGVFKKLAPKNEMRAQQAAYSLRNSVQRVLALSAIYQWKAKELSEQQATPGT